MTFSRIGRPKPSHSIGLQASGVLTDGQWHFVAGTWDGREMRIYVDGGTLAVAAEGAALWALLALLGYLQWFVLLPGLARLTQRLLARWLSPSR